MKKILFKLANFRWNGPGSSIRGSNLTSGLSWNSTHSMMNSMGWRSEYVEQYNSYVMH